MKKISNEIKIGDLIIVYFYDHAMGDSPVLIKAVGWLAKDSAKYIVLNTWDLPEFQDLDNKKMNAELCTIVKSNILTLIKMKTEVVYGSRDYLNILGTLDLQKPLTTT